MYLVYLVGTAYSAETREHVKFTLKTQESNPGLLVVWLTTKPTSINEMIKVTWALDISVTACTVKDHGAFFSVPAQR